MEGEDKALKILDNQVEELWKRDSAKVINSNFDYLVSKGLSEKDASALIRELWFACSDEYGD